MRDQFDSKDEDMVKTLGTGISMLQAAHKVALQAITHFERTSCRQMLY